MSFISGRGFISSAAARPVTCNGCHVK